MRPLMVVEVIRERVKLGDSTREHKSFAQKRNEKREKQRKPAQEQKNPTELCKKLLAKEQALEAYLKNRI